MNEATKNNEAIENQTIYTLDVTAEQIKGATPEGRKYDFIAFETTDKRGKVSKLKFRKELATMLPKEPGEYELKVDKRFISRDKMSKYPTYWVREIISFEKKVFIEVENTEDLPC